MDIVQPIKHSNRTKSLRGNTSCLTAWALTLVVSDLQTGNKIDTSWFLNMLALGLKFAALALMVLRPLDPDWAHIINSPGSSTH